MIGNVVPRFRLGFLVGIPMTLKHKNASALALVALVTFGALLGYLLSSGSDEADDHSLPHRKLPSRQGAKSTGGLNCQQDEKTGDSPPRFSHANGSPTDEHQEKSRPEQKLREDIGAAMKRLCEVANEEGIGISQALGAAFRDDDPMESAMRALNGLVWADEKAFFIFWELFEQITDPNMRWVLMRYLCPGRPLGHMGDWLPIFSQQGVNRLVSLLTSKEYDLPGYRVLCMAIASLATDKRPLDMQLTDDSLLLSRDNARLLVKWIRDGFEDPASLEKRLMLKADLRGTLGQYIHRYPEVRELFFEFARNEQLGAYLRTWGVMHALSQLGLADNDLFMLALQVLKGDGRMDHEAAASKILKGERLTEEEIRYWHQMNVIELFFRGVAPRDLGAVEKQRLELFYDALYALMNKTEDSHIRQTIGKRLAAEHVALTLRPVEEILAIIRDQDTPWETKSGLFDALQRNVTPQYLLFAAGLRPETIARRDQVLDLLYECIDDESIDERVRARAFSLLMEYYSEAAMKSPASREAAELGRLIAAAKTDHSELVRTAVAEFERQYQVRNKETAGASSSDNEQEKE